jgi:uncharacterized protein YgiM (DUF1202 family)
MAKTNRLFAALALAAVLFAGFPAGVRAEPEPEQTTAESTEQTTPEELDRPAEEEELEDEDIETGLAVKMGIVSGTGSSGIYIRELPSANGRVLYGVAEGTELVIISNEGNWYRVGYYGYVGYASADYIIPYSASGEEREYGAGTVTGSFVYLRSEPDSTADNQIMVLKEGTTVLITGVSGGWYAVDYNGVKGFVHADYLFPIKYEKVNFSRARVNTGSGVNLRASTSTSSEVVKSLLYGDEVKVLSIINGWYKVEYTYDGSTYTGFIYADYLINSSDFVDTRPGSGGGGGTYVPPANLSEGQRIVRYARNFLGYPYVWGGYLPSMGFDCSGFTQYVFAQCGYTLYYRTQQYRNGTSISYGNLQIGDLVFFDTYQNGTIGHVGIYCGDGTFIHAANPRSGVCITSMAPGSYYYGIYVCARRIV